MINIAQIGNRNTYYKFLHSMDRSSAWETNRFSANQEIPRILWNSKDHYHF
jgi:hypothetical protein